MRVIKSMEFLLSLLADVCLREDSYRFPECVPRGAIAEVAASQDTSPERRCAPGLDLALEGGGVQCAS